MSGRTHAPVQAPVEGGCAPRRTGSSAGPGPTEGGVLFGDSLDWSSFPPVNSSASAEPSSTTATTATTSRPRRLSIGGPPRPLPPELAPQREYGGRALDPCCHLPSVPLPLMVRPPSCGHRRRPSPPHRTHQRVQVEDVPPPPHGSQVAQQADAEGRKQNRQARAGEEHDG